MSDIHDAETAPRSADHKGLFATLGLAGAFLAAGLADELIVYIAPHLLGQGARPAFELPAVARMADRLDLTPLDVLSFGPDLRLRLRPAARA